jgi:hypothetical protein
MTHAFFSLLFRNFLAITAAVSISTCTGVAWAAGPVKIASDENGTKHFTVDGKAYVPIGVNYIISHQGAPYKTFDTFDTQDFHAQEIDQDLKAIADYGFNFVRLWLKGLDPDNGFSQGANKISDAYVDNIFATIHKARGYGLRVVLTGSFHEGMWLPKNYLPTTPLPGEDVVGGMNRLLLLPEMANSTGEFFHDLLEALQRKDPQILTAIFYLDLYNEFHFVLDQPPFSKFSGSYQFNGKQYDLGNAGSRQALMDDAAESWMRTVKAKVTSVKPDILVTASSFYLSAMGHDRFDGGSMTSKGANGPANYPLRPAALLRGGADLLDMHTYPSPVRPKLTAFHTRADGIMRTSEITEAARDVPIVAGEFGAYKAKFGSPAEAPEELLATEEVMCRYGYSGFAVWMWKGFGDTWMLTDEPLMQALAPKYHPEFCGRKVAAL